MISPSVVSPSSRIDEGRVSKLFVHSAAQQWSADVALDFSSPLTLTPEQRQIWAELGTVFYTMEKMGQHVLARMTLKASHQFRSEASLQYLTLQGADEGRHVYTIGRFLQRLGEPPRYDGKYHLLGQIASLGFYQIENWLFSTLFSENFASSFLRRAKGAEIDPLGSEMCRRLLIDESRHLHFLHIVLPEVMDHLSLLGRGYVKMSQYFIMKLTVSLSRHLASRAEKVGLNREELLDEVFSNVEKAYEGFGVSRHFLTFPTVRESLN